MNGWEIPKVDALTQVQFDPLVVSTDGQCTTASECRALEWDTREDNMNHNAQMPRSTKDSMQSGGGGSFRTSASLFGKCISYCIFRRQRIRERLVRATNGKTEINRFLKKAKKRASDQIQWRAEGEVWGCA